MQRRRRRTIVLVSLLVLLGVAVVLVYGWLTGPLYEPGMVRAERGLREPLAPPSQAAARPSYWLVAPDIELRYFTVGSGEDVLVLHGGPGFPPAEPWPALQPLADRYRFVFYDQRGCGESTRPFERLPPGSFYERMLALDGALGLGAQIADIERVRRILGRERLIILGHSFGALLAALYAAEFPEHVRALVLVAPADLVVLPAPHADLFATVGALLRGARVAEFEAFERELFDFEAHFDKSDAELAELYGRLGGFYAEAAGTNTDAGVAPATAALRRGRDGGFMPFAIFLSMGRRHDYRAALREVRAPVLVLHAAKDIQPIESSRAFADYFPNARFELVPGGDHFILERAGGEVARIFGDFVSTVR